MRAACIQESIDKKTFIECLNLVGSHRFTSKQSFDNIQIDGEHPLFYAIKKGCIIVVKQLLTFDPDYMMKLNSERSRNCISLAVYYEQIEIIRFLGKLQNAYFYSFSFPDFVTCILSSKNDKLFRKCLYLNKIAIVTDHHYTITTDVERFKLLYKFASTGYSIFEAIENNQLEIIKCLIEKFYYDLRCTKGHRSPMEYAILYDRIEIVKYFISIGDVAIKDFVSDCFIQAIKSRFDISITSVLLTRYKTLVPKSCHILLITFAIEVDYVPNIKLLCNTFYFPVECLHIASYYGSLQAIKWFASLSAFNPHVKLEIKPIYQTGSAMKFACMLGKYDICHFLLNYYDFTYKNLGRFIPTLLLDGHLKIANLFFKHGVMIKSNLDVAETCISQKPLAKAVCVQGLGLYFESILKVYISIKPICKIIATFLEDWSNFKETCFYSAIFF